MPIEPFVPAKPGDPILAEKWNAIQVTIRTQLEDLSAKKFNAAGGTIGGPLVVSAPVTAPAIGLGTGNPPTAPLEVRSVALVSNQSGGGLRLTSAWTGFPDTGGDRAELAVDNGAQALMIVGTRAAALANPDMNWPGSGRRVRVWDRLEVVGHALAEQTLGVKIPATQRPSQELHVGGRMYLEGGVIQRGGPNAPVVNTSDLGLYSQYVGNAVRVVTNNGPVRFFADSGAGTTSNLDVNPSGDVKARNNLLAGGRVGVGADIPQDLVHVAAPAGNIGLRIQTGAAAADVAGIRFFHGNDQKHYIGTTANGRLSVTNALSVWNGKVGVGIDTDPQAPLEVKGDLQMSRTAGTGGIRFNSGHTGWSNEIKDRAEISIDPGYKTLMIIGSVTSAQEDAGMKWPSLGRRVSIWDRLEVNGHLLSNTISVNMAPTQLPVQQLHVGGRMYIENGVIQRGGAAVNGTSDLGLYSQVAGNWIRIVTNNGPIKFFCDGNIGSNQRMSIEPNGDLYVTGRIYPGNGVNGLISDLSLKTDVTPLPSALRDVLQIRGVRFRWKDETRGSEPQVGVVAQDVEAVYPELIDIDKDGLRRVQYAGLVAPLIEAVREQQQQIGELKAALARLQERAQA